MVSKRNYKYKVEDDGKDRKKSFPKPRYHVVHVAPFISERIYHELKFR